MLNDKRPGWCGQRSTLDVCQQARDRSLVDLVGRVFFAALGVEGFVGHHKEASLSTQEADGAPDENHELAMQVLKVLRQGSGHSRLRQRQRQGMYLGTERGRQGQVGAAPAGDCQRSVPVLF